MRFHRPGKSLPLGMALIIGSQFLFAGMGVGIRFLADEVPNEVLVFFRNILGLGLLAPWLFRDGLPGLRTQVPHLHLLRGVAGLAAMYCFYYAIMRLPLAEAMVLLLGAPLYIPLIGLLWLKEPVPARVWLGVALGFGGVLVMMRPGLAGISTPVALALLGGFFAAIVQVTIRRLSRTEPTLRIVFYFAFTGTLLSALPLAWAWSTPFPHALIGLLAVAVCSTLGQVCLTQGLSMASVARLGIFSYFSVIFAAAFGWLLWQEPITHWQVAGSLLILLAGLLAGG
ncbi:MAG TPA: DMT family transporter [Chromatiaceae bacterium]|nr:DMT family transporter [Chromatiaceae bacterium]